MDPETQENDVIHRTFNVQTKSINMEARTVDVIMSTSDLDRYEERVLQNWQLDAYKKNPVVLWAHMSRALPIGRCENVRVENGALVGTIKFASEKANPLAEQCLQLFNEKVLNAVSVGFIPHSYKWSMQDDKEFLELDDNELVELSATPTPANPEALVRMRAKAMAMKTKEAPSTKAAEIKFKLTPVISIEASTKKEKQMDLEQRVKELEAQATEHKTEITSLKAQVSKGVETLADSTKALDTEKAKSTALNERCTNLETERAAQQKRADTLACEAVERDLKELIGTKITPAEKDSLVKLSLAAPELFKEHMVAIKARPDMKMLGIVVPNDPKTPSPLETKTNEDGSISSGGDDLHNAVVKDMTHSN